MQRHHGVGDCVSCLSTVQHTVFMLGSAVWMAVDISLDALSVLHYHHLYKEVSILIRAAKNSSVFKIYFLYIIVSSIFDTFFTSGKASLCIWM